MAPNEPKKRKKSNQSKSRHLRERRFEPEKTLTSLPIAVAGMVGAAALGAGVYARFAMDTTYWYWLLVPGAAVVSAALFWNGRNEPVRVGDAGVALEKDTEVVRLPWCDMKRIHVDGKTLVVDGGSLVIKVAMGAHPMASAWILSEGAKRVPDALDVKQSVAADLPQPGAKDGQSMRVEDYQVAGRPCAASRQSIAFAKDARLCPRCGEVYHRRHVPESCVSCGAKLAGREIRVPG